MFLAIGAIYITFFFKKKLKLAFPSTEFQKRIMAQFCYSRLDLGIEFVSFSSITTNSNDRHGLKRYRARMQLFHVLMPSMSSKIINRLLW